MVGPVSNHTLEQLIIAGGYSHGAVARRVNAALRGGSAYDKATVYYWLRGRNPSPGTHRALAAVLTRAFGRRVGPAALGFGATGPMLDRVLDFPPSITDGIETVTALWTVGTAPPRLPRSRGTSPRGPQRRPAARRPVGRCRRCGGAAPGTYAAPRHRPRTGWRKSPAMVTEYPARQVAALVRGRYDDHVGRDLLGAAVRITEQCGYMFYNSYGPRRRAPVLRPSVAPRQGGGGGGWWRCGCPSRRVSGEVWAGPPVGFLGECQAGGPAQRQAPQRRSDFVPCPLVMVIPGGTVLRSCDKSARCPSPNRPRTVWPWTDSARGRTSPSCLPAAPRASS